MPNARCIYQHLCESGHSTLKETFSAEAALLMKDVEESPGSHAAAAHKESACLGMGSSCFISCIFVVALRGGGSLRKHGKKPSKLRESMKPEGREAFQSLSELPQNIAEHPKPRTTESGTPHTQEGPYIEYLGLFKILFSGIFSGFLRLVFEMKPS